MRGNSGCAWFGIDGLDALGFTLFPLAPIRPHFFCQCLTAWQGPSGAGKSSLLDALADRVKLPVTGGVTVDGVPKDELSFKRVAKYVQQQDTLAAALSTRETLLYYSRLCCPWDEAEARSRADSALELLGLRDQANTYIGGALFRGLSGGQKRRVSVGVQLVFQPRVLFLDEPTSGLDSAAAHHVVTGLQKVAKQVGTTTILTIHQPSEKVYGLADGLLLLSSGRMAYFGRADAAVDHFRGISGGDVPPLTSGAEWMLDLVDTSFQEHESVEKVLKAWPESEKARELDGYLSTGAGDELDEALEESARRGFQAGLLDLLTKGSSGDVGLLWQVVVLTRLTFVNVMRNPAYMWLRYAMYIALSVMIGTVWLDIGSSADDIIDVVNVLFFIAAFMVFMSISVLPAYLDDRNIFTKDRANGAYGTLSFLLAQSIVSQPFLFLMSIICSSITYWLIGLNSNVGNFFFFVWNLYISFAVAEAIMLLIASVVPFFVVGIAVGAFLFGTFMVVQGFFIQLDKIGWWWRWFHWVAMHSYSFASFMVNEFAGSTWSCPSETEQASEGLSFCQPGQSSVSGKQVLEFYQIDPGKLPRVRALSERAIFF